MTVYVHKSIHLVNSLLPGFHYKTYNLLIIKGIFDILRVLEHLLLSFIIIRIASITFRRGIIRINGCEGNMIPLLVILMVTGFSILISCHFTPKVTWFTYYIGAVIGIFVSGMALDFWNKRNRRYLNVTEIRREI